METKKVYSAINKVQAALAQSGISKDRKNQSQGYSFRGIDDVYGAVSSLLAQHGLVILPTYEDRTVVERETKSGGQLFYVTVKGVFTLVSSEDGSTATVTTYGEAMDSGDKATNKAMSAAYKYACLQAFCIPTEGDNDADAHSHEVAVKSLKNTVETPTMGIQPQQLAELAALSMAADMHVKIDAALKKMNLDSIEKLNTEQAAKLIKWLNDSHKK